jgi:NTE family protein
VTDEPNRTDARVGLALSGGGFRASLFHLGVLARLAELDILRRVQVISTVSGGSIIGALYYVHLKNLLDTKADAEIDADDYVGVVKQVETDFLKAMRKNIRTRAIANLAKNFWMASPSYSRSDRIGDLYDRFLYKPAWKSVELPETRADERKLAKKWLGLVEQQVPMPGLKIRPPGQPHFNPRYDNDDREAKVPILLINATTLNTGHAWRFEASRMGEPPADDEQLRTVVEDIDKNVRLEQAEYKRLGTQGDFPLGLAVAASACVPLLFHPLSISKMYRGYRVQLVDGGVHDNQGVQGLLDWNCTHLLLSDASGQMADDEKPVTRIPAVAGRSISIYGDSIRDEQLVRASEGRHVALMHLRKGLEAKVLQARGGQPATARPPGLTCTDFDIDERVQERLARVRTDLDAFSEIECYSLAIDGYRMTSAVVGSTEAIAELGNGAPRNDRYWQFGALTNAVNAASNVHLRHLEAARERFFKVFALLPGLKHLPRLLAAAAIVALLAWRWDDVTGGSVRVAAGLIVVAVVAAYFFTGKTPVLRHLSGFVSSFLGPLAVAIPLWIVALLVLSVTPVFLALGKASRVVRAAAGEPVRAGP